MILLTGCQTKKNNIHFIKLPDFPLLSYEGNQQLKTAVNPLCVATKKLIEDTKEAILEYKKDKIGNKEKIEKAELLIIELNSICFVKTEKIKEWLDDLYIFNVKYYTYKEELEKH